MKRRLGNLTLAIRNRCSYGIRIVQKEYSLKRASKSTLPTASGDLALGIGEQLLRLMKNHVDRQRSAFLREEQQLQVACSELRA